MLFVFGGGGSALAGAWSDSSEKPAAEDREEGDLGSTSLASVEMVIVPLTVEARANSKAARV